MAEKGKTIDSVSLEGRVFKVPENLKKTAYIKGLDEYNEIYRKSIEDPEAFWAEKAEQLHWFKKWDKVQDCDFENARIEWFIGGKLNVSYNCLDRHLETRKDKPAIIWEGEPEGESKTFTYQDLHKEVCRFANVLKKKGIKKGDRIAIYLPMIPELAIAMLACTRIGAVHSIVFGGFSAEALRDRIQDCAASLLITSDGSFRAGRVIDLKKNADQALEECPTVKTSIVCKRTGNEVTMKEGRDVWWHEEMNAPDITTECEAEPMDAEDPLFILYTSGSTGKPKGVLHTTGGYILYVYQTFKWIFDYKEEDIFW